jgi:hypothetical protein
MLVPFLNPISEDGVRQLAPTPRAHNYAHHEDLAAASLVTVEDLAAVSLVAVDVLPPLSPFFCVL